MKLACIPNLSFLGKLEDTCPGWVGGWGGWVGWVGGFTMIIMQVSVQIGLNWNWPTGTELGKIALAWVDLTLGVFSRSYNGVTLLSLG